MQHRTPPDDWLPRLYEKTYRNNFDAEMFKGNKLFFVIHPGVVPFRGCPSSLGYWAVDVGIQQTHAGT